MKTNYTPGPWKWIPSGNEWMLLVNQSRQMVSTIPDPAYNEANARLIAAAPDLVEALQGMLGNYLELKTISLVIARSDSPTWAGASLTAEDDVHVIKARAALRKAGVEV